MSKCLRCRPEQAMNKEELLRDALDHIVRVAQQGITPTRRLDWIAIRAKVALRGDIWEPGMRDEPDNSRAELITKNVKLRDRIHKLDAENAALREKLAACERDTERWQLFCNLWAVSTEMCVAQDEDGLWSITQIEDVEGERFLPLRGECPDDAIDAALKERPPKENEHDTE